VRTTPQLAWHERVLPHCLAFAGLNLKLADAFFEAMSASRPPASTRHHRADACTAGYPVVALPSAMAGGFGNLVTAIAVPADAARSAACRSSGSKAFGHSEKVLPRAAQTSTAIGSIYAGTDASCALG